MHLLVAIAGVVDLLVTEWTRPAWVARAGEASMPRRVAVPLQAGGPLTRLTAWLHPLAQPLPGGALSRCQAGSRPGPQSGCQVLELPVDVQITEAAMETGAVAPS